MPTLVVYAGIAIAVLFFTALLFTRMLTTVMAGTIRIVSWYGGRVNIYRGPCKAWEVPLFTTATSIPSMAITIDLDISDQTADVDERGQPKPIKVRVLASAIVSVGDSNELIRTAANRFFSKTNSEQTNTLTDLLTSTGRRAINLLHHDELFNLRREAAPQTTALAISGEEDDRLAIIIKSNCSRELQDLGLVFNSLNIKSVQSDVAEARRRQSAVEAKANADIVQADQERRAREAQLAAEQAVNDKQRDLDRRKAENSSQVAGAQAEMQKVAFQFREAELKATQIAQASADAERVRIQAEASADAEAIKIRAIGAAQADAIRQVNAAIADGGNAYLALRQLEMLPQITPEIAKALAQSKMINFSSGDTKGAAGSATDQIVSVLQTLLSAQLVTGVLRPDIVNLGPTGQQGQATPAPSPAPNITQTVPGAKPKDGGLPSPKKPPEFQND
ncbi:MAG: hypothetical protein JSS72_12460 [Armatimonadetes bacterium]|nr:hypothetical protein [Armatimonadota bacterium]